MKKGARFVAFALGGVFVLLQVGTLVISASVLRSYLILIAHTVLGLNIARARRLESRC